MATSLEQHIQLLGIGALGSLLVYTLWLSRYRGLDAHITVRWVLVLCLSILGIVAWQILPIFDFTSQLQDRQLVLLVAMLVFALIAFLILDVLMRVSRQSVQIKKLVQEIAIQRMRLDAALPPVAPEISDAAPLEISAPGASKQPARKLGSALLQVSFLAWLLMAVCFNGLLLDEPFARSTMYSIAPDQNWEAFLRPRLTAAYLQ